MKYQAIKHNKRSSRVLGVFSTIQEAREAIRKVAPRAQHRGESYTGGFPYFHETDKDGARPYTIQGYAEPWGIVCSIKAEDKALLTN